MARMAEPWAIAKLLELLATTGRFRSSAGISGFVATAMIGQLEGRLQAQQEAVGQLKGQIDRQNAATAQLQQQLSQPAPAPTIVSPPYVYPYGYYAYPPLGFGVYLGRPWTGPGYYGYYGPPYGGPRFFYRHHRRHW